MTANPSTNFNTSYDAIVKQQYQGAMKLRGTTRIKSNVVGSSHVFKVYNSGQALLRTPQTDVTPMNIQQANATATLADYHAPDYVDIFDLSKLGFDEKRELATTAKNATGRQLDQIILDAADTGASATQVSDDIGGTNTGINLAKILRAKRLMDQNGVPNDNQRYMAIHAIGVEQALAVTEVNSRDYNILLPLMTGEINAFSGFKFAMIEDRDEGGLDLTSNIRKNIAWHKDAIGLAIGIDFRTEINYIPEKTSTLVNVLFSAGAVVIDNKGVYEVLSYEA